MSFRNDAECYNYLCDVESDILILLCAKLAHVDLMYYITMFKTYAIKISKVSATSRSTYTKKSIMLEQLHGIIKVYERVYLDQRDDSESSSRSGNGSSDEDFVLDTGRES